MDFALFHFPLPSNSVSSSVRPCVVLFELVEGLLVVVNLFEKKLSTPAISLAT